MHARAVKTVRVFWNATALHFGCLFLGTMGDGIVPVPDVFKVMNLFLGEEHGSGDGMNGCIAPSFIEETTGLVKVFKVLQVALGAPQIQTSNLEIGPEMTQIVFSLFIGQEFLENIVLVQVLLVLFDEIQGFPPQRRNGFLVLGQGQREAVFLAIFLHENKGIFEDVAGEIDTWFNPPVIIVILQEFVTEEETRVVTTHMTIG